MHRILVADDDKRIVTALSLRLRNEGYEVVTAYDGPSALELAKRERFSLMVMDISMPFANGIRTVRDIQDAALQNGPPVIFITASKLPNLREEAESVGAAGFFEKPYEPVEILARVREVLDEPIIT